MTCDNKMGTESRGRKGVSKGKWEPVGQAASPSLHSKPPEHEHPFLYNTDRARPRVTVWRAELTQSYPWLDPTCQPQAAERVGGGA